MDIDSWVAEGLVYAVDNGAKVINLSLGGYDTSSTLLEAVDYAWNNGCVVVAAAGNDNTSLPAYPAAYPNCNQFLPLILMITELLSQTMDQLLTLLLPV